MNNTIQTLIKYEWTVLIRNQFQLLMLVVVFVFGLYAIYYGQSEIRGQQETIKAITALEHEEFSEYTSSFKEELETQEQEKTHDVASKPAYAWYRHGYHAILPPHDYAPLAIGQRDLFRYYYRLTGTSLHYQLFENELANPVNLMAGNFDLSFVLIYLFPLVIIAFCYGLYSSEEENGTLPLLQIQAISIRKIILIRLAFYFLLITGLALLISFIGLFATSNPLNEQNLIPAVIWVLSTITYCAFWFGLMFLIVSFRKNSAFNAISAAGCWLFFLIIIPAVLNVIVTIKYPLSSAKLAGITRRTGLDNEDDDEESREVIMEFFSHRPDLAGSDSLIENNLMPKAYAAFTTLKDLNNQRTVDYYNAQVAKRNEWTSQFHWLSPSVNMQHVLTHIAQTDLHTFLSFQDSLVAFHKEITNFYFVRLFWDKPLLLEDYSKLPEFKTPEIKDRWTVAWWGVGQISLISSIGLLLGFFKMNGRRRR